MIVFLILVLASITLYALVLLAVYIIHAHIFYKRFVPDGNITFYNEKEFGCTRKDTSFKVKNITLKGCFITPNKEYDKSKIIIFCHGMGSSKESYMQDISTIANGGFEVFCFDYIGVNESEGTVMGGFAQGLRSVDYAIKFIHDLYQDKDIYVIGHSWGAFNALNSVRYNAYVKKVCAIAPFISINDVILAITPHIAKMFVINTEFVEGIRFGKYAYANSISTLKKFNGEVLIIHSEDDDTVIYDASSKKLMKKFNDVDRFKFVIVNGKKHQPQYTYESVNKLYNFYEKSHELDGNDLINYMKTINFHELGVVDMDIMNQIIAFFK